MQLLLIYFSIFLLVHAQPSFLNNFVAIQNQQQTYFSYLPFIDSCSYNEPNLIPGSVTLTNLTDKMLYQKLEEEEIEQFWNPVYNGFDIALVLNSQIAGLYSGYILYNSKMQGFNREVILYNVSSSSLTFNFTIIKVDPQTMTLSFNIKNTTKINLNQQAKQILSTCNETNSSNFAYIGNSTFIYVCSQQANGFSFLATDQNNQIQIFNFDQIMNGTYSIITNFQIFFFSSHRSSFAWDCSLLVTSPNQTSLYFLQLNNQTLTIIAFQDLKSQSVLILNRIWGEQQRLQIDRWTDVYGSLNIELDLYFPGDIVSIYVNRLQSIYLQTTTQTLNYLCIFNSEGTLYANVTFEGSVLYYGSEITFIYNETQNEIYMLQIQRPIYLINGKEFGNSSSTNSFAYINFMIACEWVAISVNFQIFWTSPLYPSALIYLLDQSSIYSTDSVFAFEISQMFLKVGPAFEVIPLPSSAIQTEVIESSMLILKDKGIGILNISANGNGNYELVVVTSTSVYEVNSQGKILTLVIEPCGFSDIVSAQILNNDELLIINSNGLNCFCQPTDYQCTIVNGNPQQQEEQFTQASSSKLNLFSYSQQNQQNETILFKINLYQLIRKGYIISILQNNSAILYEAYTHKILDMVTMSCPSQNSTNGLIYTKQFYNPYLILFCQQGTDLTQYTIISNRIVFQRVIPLYGFKTRSGELSIQSTQTNIFLSVDSIYNIYPVVKGCCVLRLNPVDDTSSVIMQIINASSIVATESFNQFDFVLLNVLTPEGQKSLVRVYIPEKWIAFNLTNSNQTIASDQNITISFYSPVYNFAFVYNISVTFNLTNANLSFTKDFEEVQNFKQKTIIFNSSITKYKLPFYSSTINYNMSDLVCGALFNSYFSRLNSGEKNFKIFQTFVLKQNKLIGGSGINFIQIIDPYKWNQPNNFSLNNLLLFISDEKMYIYAKIINNVQLVPLSNFTLPEKSCEYYPYYIINSTAVVLTSNCQGLDFNFQTPFLTLNYNPQNNNITSSYEMIGVPISLRNINTIALNNSNTMIVGILEGPMYTETGRLIMYVNQSWSPLYISSSYSFLIDYSCFSSSITSPYFIMTVNPFLINVFISPTVQPNKAPSTPNYTFIYTTIIKQTYCSTIKILNATLDFSYVILSCSANYYLLRLNFSSNELKSIQKFNRYSQCALYDYHKPQDIFINNTLLVFFAQCRQNDYNLKLSAYEQFTTSNYVNIYTGYLQVYTMTGPLGPNCQKDTLSPIRIIPISTSMDRSLFLPYLFGNIYKFVYSQIEGMLIDNFFEIDPQLTLTFEPENEEYTFPALQFTIINEFQSRSLVIQTNQILIKGINYKGYILFWFFVIVNLTTFIFLLCFFARGKKKIQFGLGLNTDEQPVEGEGEEQVEVGGQIKYEDQSNRRYTHKASNISKNRRTLNYELELFFLKPANENE